MPSFARSLRPLQCLWSSELNQSTDPLSRNRVTQPSGKDEAQTQEHSHGSSKGRHHKTFSNIGLEALNGHKGTGRYKADHHEIRTSPRSDLPFAKVRDQAHNQALACWDLASSRSFVST